MIKYLNIIFTLLVTTYSWAQKDNTSAYSFFGIGDNNPQLSVGAMSMGHLNVANVYRSELNLANPAAASALRFTSFSMAGKSKFLWVSDAQTVQNTSVTGLTSLALGVPIGKKAGILAGLQPASNVGYLITENFNDAEGNTLESNTYKGSGGTNRFFGSFGYEIARNLRLGIEADYLFGSIDNEIFNQRKDVFLATRYRLISALTGSSVKVGAQYQRKFNDKFDVHLGASYTFDNNITATSEAYLYSYTFNNGGEKPIDTIINNQNVKGIIHRPGILTMGTGVGKKQHWYAGFEYETQAAQDFSESIFKNNNKVQYTGKSRLSLGGFWIPKINSITNYWERVVYRGGLRFEQTGLAVKGLATSSEFTPLNDFGISFGLGLPVGNQLSRINLGLEYGKRGETNKGLIKENYFNLRLSLDLSDKWFRERKIN